jgi:hypothetical protein
MLPIKSFVCPSILFCFGYFGVHDWQKKYIAIVLSLVPFSNSMHLSPFEATQRTVGSLTI